MKPTAVFGWERSRVPVDDPTSTREKENVHYDIPLVPHIPLRIGLHVRIHELHHATSAASNDDAQPNQYTSTTTGVEGRIVAIRAMEKTTTELVVKNDNGATYTEYAYLTIHHEDGVTVRLTPWLRAFRKLLYPLLPSTRNVPLERDAVLLRSPRRPRPLSGTIYNLVELVPASE